MASAAHLPSTGVWDAQGNLRRFLRVALLSLLVTVALFFLMHRMIYRDTPDLPDEERRRVADILMEEVEIITNIDEQLPDKPDEPEEEPPEPELPEIEEVEVEQDMDMSIGTGGVQISLGGGLSSDGEYLPIVKVAPIYPRMAQTRGIEGYCIISYTVTVSGSVRDPSVEDCSSSIFRNASLRASLRFKYKPRIIDGEPVEVRGVLNRFIYQLEDE